MKNIPPPRRPFKANLSRLFKSGKALTSKKTAHSFQPEKGSDWFHLDYGPGDYDIENTSFIYVKMQYPFELSDLVLEKWAAVGLLAEDLDEGDFDFNPDFWPYEYQPQDHPLDLPLISPETGLIAPSMQPKKITIDGLTTAAMTATQQQRIRNRLQHLPSLSLPPNFITMIEKGLDHNLPWIRTFPNGITELPPLLNALSIPEALMIFESLSHPTEDLTADIELINLPTPKHPLRIALNITGGSRKTWWIDYNPTTTETRLRSSEEDKGKLWIRNHQGVIATIEGSLNGGRFECYPNWHKTLPHLITSIRFQFDTFQGYISRQKRAFSGTIYSGQGLSSPIKRFQTPLTLNATSHAQTFQHYRIGKKTYFGTQFYAKPFPVPIQGRFKIS